jgi:UPF0716 protein FxsA
MDGVFGLLGLLFLLVPLAELFVIVKVGASLGVLNTIGLLVLISLAGAWLVRREGLSVLARAQRELDAGRVPTTSLVDGLLILAAGALLLTPGFLTDIVGVLLLLPPVRALLRRALVARYRHRLTSPGAGGPRVRVWRPGGVRHPGAVDVDVVEEAPGGDVPGTQPPGRSPPGGRRPLPP